MRVGIGFDRHRIDAGRPLVLGGVEIAPTGGLHGHSDADVLTHAIVDALLGALALGDIGRHFPDDDPAWEGADSRTFLKEAMALVARAGYRVGNVDATLVAEAPRLAPHVRHIRASVADTMGIDVDAVSVKATTAEGLGPIGRGEGMECQAIVMLLR